MNVMAAAEEGHHASQRLFRRLHPLSSWVLQKACQNNVPWSANTIPLTSKRYKSLLHDVETDLYVCIAGDRVTASFSMDVLGGTKKVVAHFWCQPCETIHISQIKIYKMVLPVRFESDIFIRI
jgi:hypothetical protein